MRCRSAARRASALAACLATGLVSGLAACGDEPRRLVPATATASGVAREGAIRTSGLSAGGLRTDSALVNPYADDGAAVAMGRELFTTMNCAGCHGPAGGGGIGPPLADADWIYGAQPENVVQSILQGRPNGMPAFGARLPEAEAWKVAAYVKSLGP